MILETSPIPVGLVHRAFPARCLAHRLSLVFLWCLASTGCQPTGDSTNPTPQAKTTTSNTGSTAELVAVPTEEAPSEPVLPEGPTSLEPGIDSDIVQVQALAPAPAKKKPATVTPPAAVVDRYLDGWEKPDAALIFTGEIHGYFEPCGCSPTQSGGFARRGDLVQKLEKRGWPVAAFDVGGLLKRSRQQDHIKFETMMTGMQSMKYAGLGLGTEELILGPDYLLAQYVPDDPRSIPFLGANIVFFDVEDLGVPLRYKTIQVGTVKIGVTAVLGLSHKDSIAPEGVQTNIKLIPPKEALAKVLPKMKAEKPDLLLLLSHGSLDEAKQLAAAFPEFPLILTAGSPEDASGKPVVVNNTWILETGMKGRTAGVLGYYAKQQNAQEPKRPFRFELIDLNKQRFPGDMRMIDLMRTYQQRLIDEKISVSDKWTLQHPSGWQFVGSEQCGACHKKAYEHWKTTAHGKATETLIHGRKGEEATWVKRLYDPECLSCHVTGWEPQEMVRFQSGYLSEEATPHLRHQGCENCHGPGSKHIEVEQASADKSNQITQALLESTRSAVRRSADKNVCTQCHDAENSPKFEFDRDWAKVEHPWRD